jgi:diaminohydroxyphosphoribosylaminopyrimidine deaminase/5-amino-6-(5-phosphoribosylamino)uracil reductase
MTHSEDKFSHSFTPQDKTFMQRALALAEQGHYSTSPTPRVGCVIIKHNDIIGEGFHYKAGQGHAEVNALASLTNKTQSEGATAYVTLEPCSHYGRTPPCAEGLINAGVTHVVIAMVDPNPQVAGRGIALLNKAGITTQVGLFESEANALNRGFISLMTTGLPFVRCKMASSLDGKTAMANGESQWITSSEARSDVQRLRAQSCAVISGVESVMFDNAKMNVRFSALPHDVQSNIDEKDLRQPTRVIIDPHNKLSRDLVTSLALFESKSPILIMRKKLDVNISANSEWPDFVEHQVCKTVVDIHGIEKIDLKGVLHQLAKRGLNDVLIESGARLAGAFIEQDLVNELILFQAPKLMGASAKSLVELPHINALADAKMLKIKEITLIGEDIRIVAALQSEA